MSLRERCYNGRVLNFRQLIVRAVWSQRRIENVLSQLVFLHAAEPTKKVKPPYGE
jgi:hypothetical protein